MKKKIAVSALAVMIIIFIIGLILVFTSETIGNNAAYVAIQKKGGVMGGEEFQKIINTTSTNFKIFGILLSVLGEFGILLSGYAVYKEL